MRSMLDREIAKPMTAARPAAATVALAGAAAAPLLLACLHALSPEFDPAWRMVSEYANGHYGWVLSLMFAAWGLSSLALVVAIWSEARTMGFRIGLLFLALAGAGQLIAASPMGDINHDTLHGLAGALGIAGLPIAAMLTGVSLGRTERWSPAKRTLLWTATLTWVSLVLLGATFALLVFTFSQLGPLPAQPPKVLPAGVIGLVGWANRLLVVLYCAWVAVVAGQAIRLLRGGTVGIAR
jgi:uncharacterized protein DUF998